ncbi:hypothetical protein BH10ACI2_BH10ACI2_02880 [soil metagenome]
MNSFTKDNFRFADFELDSAKRLLIKNGVPVALNSKTFDLLKTLVERRGEVLSREELIEDIWPNQFVEESNLTVQVSTLRKSLGETLGENKFIVTVPGKGYKFVGEVIENPGEISLENHRYSGLTASDENAKNDSPALRAETTNRKITFFLIAGGVLFFLLGGGYLLFREYSAKDPATQIASITRLTESGKVGLADLSPDGKLFAYSVGDGESTSLWLGHTDGGEPIEIRPPAKLLYQSLKFAPDGSSLYYVSSDNYEGGALYRIPVFGGVPEKIRDDVHRAITFAPDGKRFAFVRFDDNLSELVMSDIRTAIEQVIAVPPTKFSFAPNTPAWSPDGSTIAVGAATKDEGSGFDIYTVNVADGGVKPLTTQAWNSIYGLAWQPDGSGLIAIAIEKTTSSSQLWQISFPEGKGHRLFADLSYYGRSLSLTPDGGNLLVVQGQKQSNVWIAPADDLSAAKQITFGSFGTSNGWNGLAWMPDGKIAYTKLSEKGITIWTMNADGSNQKQLIPNGGDNHHPVVTGDGRFVVFQSTRGGSSAIWRSDIDGGNLVQLTHDEPAEQPALSPDGKWIIFNSNRSELGTLRRISIEGGESVRLSEKAFSWVGISPDSKSFAASYDETGKSKIAILAMENGEILMTFDVPRLANFRFGIHWTPDGKAVTYRDWANGIWKQELSGGAPTRLQGLPPEKLYGYGWSLDGKQFAYVRGAEISDVVLIRNAK